MSGIRFRTRLATAMSLVVIGITGATLWLTQHRIQQSWQKLFEEQFHAQIAFFSERQVRRLEDVARRSLETSEHLIPLLESADPDPKEVYDVVSLYMGWLGRVSAYSGLRPGQPGAAPGPQPGPQPDPQPGDPPPSDDAAGDAGPQAAPRVTSSIRVIDSRGEFIDAPDRPRFDPFRRRPGGSPEQAGSRQPPGSPPPPPAASTESPPGSPGASEIINIREQETGYIAFGGDSETADLQEFITTPVMSGDGDDARVIGALFVALPAGFRESELAMSRFSGLTKLGLVSSGIWIDGHLYTETIPEDVRSGIGDRLQAALALARDSDSRDRFRLHSDNGDQLVFFQLLNPGSPFRRAVHVTAFSLQGLQQEQRNVQAWIAGFGGLALLGAMGIIWLISHGLTIPMKELVQGTQKIRSGEFDVQVPVRSRDEVGELASSFNEMARGLADGVRYQTLLAQIADREVAERLISGREDTGGRLVTASILFCDIRGFTALTADMPPGEIVDLLNEHMSALMKVVHECGGVVDKFVGDMIMAVFGALRNTGDEAASAARCARGMIAARAALNRRARTPVEVGIGLATGQVVAGCMGSTERLSFTVLGERVNLASRLCSAAGPAEILIDAETRAALPSDESVTPLAPVLLKGYTDPVPVWRLESPPAPANLLPASR